MQYCAPIPNVQVGSAIRVKKGEDSHDFRIEVIGSEDVLLVMVADGHGGNAAAACCRDKLFDLVVKAANGDASAKALQAAGRAAFKLAHADVRAVPGCTAGCTLTLCALNAQRDELTCCNAGDTLAYLISSELPGTVQMITEDHRIENCASERERLRAMGGQLGRAVGQDGQPGGPMRIIPGGLAVARGIGDADCADFVSCEPHVETRTLPDDFVLVVATDGLWDGTTLKQVKSTAVKACQPEDTAEQLLKLSVKFGGLFDDMTCVIVQRHVTPSPSPSLSWSNSKVSRLWMPRRSCGRSSAGSSDADNDSSVWSNKSCGAAWSQNYSSEVDATSMRSLSTSGSSSPLKRLSLSLSASPLRPNRTKERDGYLPESTGVSRSAKPLRPIGALSESSQSISPRVHPVAPAGQMRDEVHGLSELSNQDCAQRRPVSPRPLRNKQTLPPLRMHSC